MFSTKKTINGGHDDDPNQYYNKFRGSQREN
jgi:hypothetical protein